MKLCWRKRRIKFCFRYQKYINIFFNYMLQRLKLVPLWIYINLCKDQPIDVFTTYIFQSFMGFRESSSIKIWWDFIWFFQNLTPLYRFIARVIKRIWLTYHELVLENSSSAPVYTLKNTITYLKTVKYRVSDWNRFIKPGT